MFGKLITESRNRATTSPLDINEPWLNLESKETLLKNPNNPYVKISDDVDFEKNKNIHNIPKNIKSSLDPLYSSKKNDLIHFTTDPLPPSHIEINSPTLLDSEICLDHQETNKSENTFNSCVNLSIFNISEITYVPKSFSGPEPLMYTTISILGQPIKSLVDCGASRSFVGCKTLDLMKNLGLTIEKCHGVVQISNSSIQTVSDEVIAPIELMNKVRLMRIRVLNSLPVDFVVGLDFLQIFSISVNYEKRKWIFNDDPSKTHNFDIENWKPEMCCGLIELTYDQASKIK